MQRRDHGHPVAALLLLFSMFAFAFVFHAVTRPTYTVPAHFDRQLAAFAGSIAADAPAPHQSAAAVLPVKMMPLIMTAAAEATPAAPAAVAAIDSTPALEASSWSTAPTPLPATITPTLLAKFSQEDAGAVTRALASTRSALRNAFKKTF